MRPPDRARAAINLCGALSLFSRCSSGAVSLERDGVLLIASSARVTGAFHAAAVRVVPGRPASRVLDVASQFASVQRREVTIWAAEDTDADLVDTLVRAGLTERPAAAGMYRPLPFVDVEQAPDGDRAQLRRVITAVDVEAFAEVHRRSVIAAGRPPPAAVDHYATLDALTDPCVDAFVAWADDVPVAAAMSLTTGSVTGIYWVVTHPDHRRRGLGRAVTAAAAHAGTARGADLLVLQATAMGVPLYQELGFLPFTIYRRWLVTPTARAGPPADGSTDQ